MEQKKRMESEQFILVNNGQGHLQMKKVCTEISKTTQLIGSLEITLDRSKSAEKPTGLHCVPTATASNP